MLEDALALQEVGCFAIVFEAIPAAVTERSWSSMEIPVIGIGAGPATDGQVLVFHDLLGINDRPARRNSSSATPSSTTRWSTRVAAYADEVRARRFPGPEHVYGVEPEELERLKERLAKRAHA